MKRLTMAELTKRAQDNPGTEIEPDNEGGIAFLAIGRRVFYAHLEAATVRVDGGQR